MKNIYLTLLCLSTVFGLRAQVTDTVSLGAGYANQKWYSLQNDEQGFAPKNNWDLAFDVSSGFGTSIHINSPIGTMLWTYPLADTAAWNTLDTAGITLWTPQYNSDTSWNYGAFDVNITTNPNDVGWGIYNNFTHIITGDSLFVIKLSDGSYKKIWIINVAGGGYNFKYADLDGTNLQTVFINKSTYPGKNFSYYSLQTNSALDREPVASANWDLLFTQYTGFVPTPYTLTGVLSNRGVLVAQADNVANPLTYNNWPVHTLQTEINIIGSDWKNYSGAWYISQDTVYFVKSKVGDLWKLQFTGFGGASNGNFIFVKEKLSTASLEDINGNNNVQVFIYPNPSTNGNFTILTDLDKQYTNVKYSVIDQMGRVVTNGSLSNSKGIYAHTVNTNFLEAGVYSVIVSIDSNQLVQKLIIK